VEALMRANSNALPYRRAALLRHLEEFPVLHSGLLRTEKQLVEVIRDGMRTPFEIFIATPVRETGPFLGDTSVWSVLRDISSGEHALLGATVAVLRCPRTAGRFCVRSGS
jgi:hypothetical protein